MKVLNLFAGPCAGKSTVAADLFSRLKRRGVNVELVTEYAKDVVWEGRHNILKDQLYVVAKQNRRLERLRGKVDIVITDSPLLLCAVYSEMSPHPAHFKPLVKDLWDSYDNLSVFVERPGGYDKTGRTQGSIEEAKDIDHRIKSMLIDYRVPFSALSCYDSGLKLTELVNVLALSTQKKAA